MDKMIDTDGKYAAKVVTDFRFIPKREDLIQRGALLDAYDAAHKGPPGGARKLIAIAPAVDAVPVVCCADCKYSDTFPEGSEITMPMKCVNIRYGGVMPDWYCEHGERRDSE